MFVARRALRRWLGSAAGVNGSQLLIEPGVDIIAVHSVGHAAHRSPSRGWVSCKACSTRLANPSTSKGWQATASRNSSAVPVNSLSTANTRSALVDLVLQRSKRRLGVLLRAGDRPGDPAPRLSLLANPSTHGAHSASSSAALRSRRVAHTETVAQTRRPRWTLKQRPRWTHFGRVPAAREEALATLPSTRAFLERTTGFEPATLTLAR